MAAREIAAGEEVCISYVALDLPKEERQHIFQHKYGFECACPLCKVVHVSRLSGDTRGLDTEIE